MIRQLLASASMEIVVQYRQRFFVALNILAAMSFLVMVSLFGLTGSYAPVAVLNSDRGSDGADLIQTMADTFHSFSVKKMDPEEAARRLRTGRLAGIVRIPEDFSEQVERGATIPVAVEIDNVNVDVTEDIQRALPSAIVAFGRSHGFPGLRVEMVEHDVLSRDTGYIPYLVVSALALDCMLIAGILGGFATAGEWEGRTIKFLRLAPASPAALLAGKLLAAASLAGLAIGAAVAVTICLYRVPPVSPVATFLALVGCILIFTCFGAWLGSFFRRTMVVVPLLFGLVMPFYVCSGALEPVRFDGDLLWIIAHASPIYYVVGVLEWAFHGLHVTPEPVYVDLLILSAMAALSVGLTLRHLSKGRIA